MSAERSLVEEAYGLVAASRPEAAVALIEKSARAPLASHAVLAAYAEALKSAKRRDEALLVNQRITERFSGSGVAWHNLAAALDEAGRSAEAVAAAEQAFRLGVDAPETWVVLAHARTNLQDHDGAAQAYDAALRRRPTDALAACDYARLLWAVGGDWRKAVAPLRALRAAGGLDPGAVVLESRILQAAGCTGEREALLADALRRRPADVVILCAAAHAANVEGQADRAAELAQRAVGLVPDYAPALVELADVRLAQGRGPEAFAAARRAVQAAPLDMSTWAWLATAARATGDPTVRELYDYAAMVGASRIAAPPGWSSLDSFLGDLANALGQRHQLQFEPPDQSVRQGTQTSGDLSRSQVPELKALFAAFEAPIRAYLAGLGSGRGPLRARNTGRYRVDSAWSVRLRANGFHDNHFHPHGWISCVFYVETPQAVRAGDGRQGWLKLGEPPAPNSAAFPPEHFVQPEPGLLVLFPSYMWHGTVPFTTTETRLSVAFDILPA